jgi:ankyrin repeat protein
MNKIFLFLFSILAVGSQYAMEGNSNAQPCAESSKPLARKDREFTLQEFPSPEKPKSEGRRFLTSSMPETELHARKRLKHDEDVKQLLAIAQTDSAKSDEQKALENAKGHSLLLDSSQSDEYITATKEALQMAVDPNCKSSIGYSPLHNAVRSLAPRTTKLLLEYGADPIAEDATKDTPLHLSMYYPFTWDANVFKIKDRIASMLLAVMKKQEKNNLIDSKNSFGNTPLLRLLNPGQEMKNEHREALANKLLAAGAKPTEKNLFNKDAITLARECGCDALAKQMQQQAPVQQEAEEKKEIK